MTQTQISGTWLSNPPTQHVMQVLGAGGAQVLLVGGCVRNALLGVAVGDIDIATDVHPETVIRLAEAAGLRAVPTGLDHGTVTVIADGLAHEVTTFRRDMETDGRHAVVSFSDSVAEDAARRDFTMNALYARADGRVVDPLGGMDDLQARRVRFIGDAHCRIAEDYLRSLRYFRFHAWYGDAAAGFDAEALAAIAGALDELAELSRERVGAEMTKLLGAPDPAPAVAAMRQCGVLNAVLPGADDRALAPLVHLEGVTDTTADPRRRLAAITGEDMAKALRLSRKDAQAVLDMRAAATGTASPSELGWRLGPVRARDAMLLRSVLLDSPWDATTPAQIETGAAAEFPVTAQDLMPRYQGAALGAQLRVLQQDWIASGFVLTRADLLARG